MGEPAFTAQFHEGMAAPGSGFGANQHAIGRANHLGGNVLVAGTTDAEHPRAVVIVPPSRLTPINSDSDWFRARGENNAYLPWWGRRLDTDYKVQGYSY